MKPRAVVTALAYSVSEASPKRSVRNSIVGPAAATSWSWAGPLPKTISFLPSLVAALTARS